MFVGSLRVGVGIPTVQDAELLAKHPPDNEQRFNQNGQIREILDQLLDACLELHRPHHPDLEADSVVLPLK